MRRTDGFSLEMNRIALDGCRIGAALKPVLEALGRSEFAVAEFQYIFMVNVFALLSGRPDKFLAVKKVRSGRIRLQMILVFFGTSTPSLTRFGR